MASELSYGYFSPTFWSHIGGISLPSSITSVLSIATTLESYANCSRCLARLSARNKRTLLGQTVGRCWQTTRQSGRFQGSRWHKQKCGWFLLPCLESVQTVVLCRFWLQCSRGRSFAGIVGSNPAEEVNVRLLCCAVCRTVCGLSNELTTRPEESYRVC